MTSAPPMRKSVLIALGCALLVALACAPSRGAEPAPATQKASGKLVIVKAVYGDLPDGAKTDVTDKVKDMVKDGVLSVDATNDNFGDPAEGIVKKLKVDYTFDGKEKSKTVEENETLTVSNTGE
jgi:hypothetical protein